jgi:D-alanine-D-alanine ligase
MNSLPTPESLGRVAVLFGGSSSERPVSLQSGAGVLAALLELGVNAYAFDPAEHPLSLLKEQGCDLAFIALHGGDGENGTLQGALEFMGIPYTGCGVMASAIAMDKWRSKLLWQGAGLPIPPFVLLNEDSDGANVVAELGLPLFVKPANGGSSIGISKVTQTSELKAAYELAKQYDTLVLAEKYIGGGEYTCPILGDVALPSIKIEPATDWYDYNAKYVSDETQYHCPSGLRSDLEQKAQALALRAFQVLGGKGWGRIDFLMEGDDIYLLEANTAPGMTSHSLVPMSARVSGLAYGQLCLTILSLAHVE